MRKRANLLMAAAFALAPSTVLAHGENAAAETSFGRAGNAAKPARVVEVVMRDDGGRMRFQPDSFTVRQGEQLRFRIKNEGLVDHEFVMATREENLKHAEDMKKNPEMEHDEPNMKRLKPNESKEVLWQFTKAGKIHIGCLIPGHLEAGMEARVVVTPAKKQTH